jgi:hypothetical protein
MEVPQSDVTLTKFKYTCYNNFLFLLTWHTCDSLLGSPNGMVLFFINDSNGNFINYEHIQLAFSKYALINQNFEGL